MTDANCELVETIKDLEIYNEHHREWKSIRSMDIEQVARLLVCKARKEKITELLSDDVFKSLVLNLADLIEGELEEDSYAPESGGEAPCENFVPEYKQLDFYE